jgi:hypothetical protein
MLYIVPDIDTIILLHLHYIVPDIVYAATIRYRLRYRPVPGAIALCLPSGKRPWTGASDSMLPERQLSQYNSSLLQW